jgi:hypothetical protein
MLYGLNHRKRQCKQHVLMNKKICKQYVNICEYYTFRIKTNLLLSCLLTFISFVRLLVFPSEGKSFYINLYSNAIYSSPAGLGCKMKAWYIWMTWFGMTSLKEVFLHLFLPDEEGLKCLRWFTSSFQLIGYITATIQIHRWQRVERNMKINTNFSVLS